MVQSLSRSNHTLFRPDSARYGLRGASNSPYGEISKTIFIINWAFNDFNWNKCLVCLGRGHACRIVCHLPLHYPAKNHHDCRTQGRNSLFYKRIYLLGSSTVPFFFIHVPFYICILMPLMDLDTGIISDFLPFLFAWSPATNPLIVLYFSDKKDSDKILPTNPVITLGKRPMKIGMFPTQAILE
ncbi:unnamed protein product [Haemonchus placei]|uniref:G_PROTEIN_RECEP_F1_2 domain-containing protein n=1 Tax=Haemonchus placei TaxID=6290 RepID=A0A0N4WS94_HAEPC|nr:unnamed protein product [Haemonchus placei]